MKKDIKKRIAELEAEVKKHQEDYEKLPTIIVGKQGAILEFTKLLEDKKEK